MIFFQKDRYTIYEYEVFGILQSDGVIRWYQVGGGKGMNVFKTDTMQPDVSPKVSFLDMLERNRLKQLERSKCQEDEEAKKLARIRAKLESGEELSEGEMRFLKEHDSQLYALAFRVQIKRKTVEEECKHAHSKEEVNDIYLMHVTGIAKDDPAKKYIVAALANVMEKVKESAWYKELPQTSEDEKKENGKGNSAGGIQYEITLGSYQESFLDDSEISFEATM